jgi:hypothetical protein
MFLFILELDYLLFTIEFWELFTYLYTSSLLDMWCCGLKGGPLQNACGGIKNLLESD